MLEEKYMIEGKDKHNIIFEEQYDYFNIRHVYFNKKMKSRKV